MSIFFYLNYLVFEILKIAHGLFQYRFPAAAGGWDLQLTFKN
jgi:hypothetical protein